MTTNDTLPKRKGVILLLVLAMMTFFAILVAAFLVISSQQYRESTTNRRIGEFVQSPRDDLHAAILELIVGADLGSDSEIRTYSLGATLYGDLDFSTYPWIRGTISSNAAADATQSNLLWLDLSTVIPRNQIQYAGNVITLRDYSIPNKWKSTRIVDFNYDASNNIDSVLVQPIAGFSLADYQTDYYINGPAFGGTGTDYNLDYTAPGTTHSPFLAWIDGGSVLVSSFQDAITSAGRTINVDNDGDGIPDGGWVQTSLPTRSTKDGRQYRPMFSFLVLDLDGRLNLNVHGNNEQQYCTSFSDTIYGNNQPDFSGVFGIGHGPAAIDLQKGFDTLQNLVTTPGAIPFYASRYSGTSETAPGQDNSMKADNSAPGFYENDAQKAQAIEKYDVYAGTAPDPWDTNILSYDLLGHRSLYANAAGDGYHRFWKHDSVSNEWLDSVLFNNPYEFNPNQVTAHDEPFTLPELEAILRMNDLDQKTMPTRLKDLFGLSNLAATNSTIRYEVTTISNNVPKTPTFVFTDSSGVTRSGHLRDLIANCVSRSAGGGDVDTLMSYLTNAYNLTGNDKTGRPYLSQHGLLDVNALLTDPAVLPASTDHYTGLAKRMDFARAVYILLMALSYDQIFGQNATTGTDNVFSLDPNFQSPGGDPLLVGNAQNCREYVAIRLAQWAINLVDFMDPDATMTPFVFDVDPFNGWSAPNNYIGIAGESDLQSAITASGSHLVWGLEPSDLLITETLNFHNRRVADTKAGTLLKDPEKSGDTDYADDDLDQVMIPQGSSFFELYCAANPNRPMYDSKLYKSVGTGYELDLDAMADATHPVWRIVIGESAHPHASASRNSIVEQLKNNPATYSFQPKQTVGEATGRGNLLRPGITTNDIDIDRIVWLAPTAPVVGAVGSHRIFYNRSGSRSLAPNEYLVIGPRMVTYLGSEVGTLGKPAGPCIDLRTSSTDFIVQPEAGETLPNPKIMIAAATVPATWGSDETDLERVANLGISGSYGIGINISAPLSDAYYPKPTHDNTHTSLKEAYCDLTGGLTGDFADLTDHGLADPIIETPGIPLSEDKLVGEGFVVMYKSVFLQRVADPSRAYDDVTNPYITVDWNMADLKVFNGEKKDSLEGDEYNGLVPAPPLAESTPKRFGSRQWMLPYANATLPNPRERHGNWLATGTDIEEAIVMDSTTLKYQPNLNFGLDPAFRQFPVHTLGRLNTNPEATPLAPLSGFSESDSRYNGAPGMPFIHFPWNDAPLANPFEVMQVPASAPGRLGIEFVDKEKGGAAGAKRPYEASSFGTNGRFAHLLNFFSQVNDAGSAGSPEIPATPAGTALNLAPILDCIHIPSRFLGTRDWYNLSGSGDPYSVSRCRDPGLVNLNTMTEATFHALMGGRTTANYSDFRNEQIQNGGNGFRGISSSDDIDETILRRNGNYPLFVGDYSGVDPNCLSIRANSYNVLEGLQRLSSMTTTTSNTFAVWVTLGYLDESTGNELGSETGEITRHRAFYILDRSIPFGYIRGEKLNAEDIILLRRFIE